MPKRASFCVRTLKAAQMFEELWSMVLVTICSERWRFDPALLTHGVFQFYAFDIFYPPHGIG
jgi:hypothetical protein